MVSLLLWAHHILKALPESKRSGKKASLDEKIEHFRTIHFDDWLRMTMQVGTRL